MTQPEIDQKAQDTYLKKCTFNDECDFCNTPTYGTFVRNRSGYDCDDDFYWICGRCFINTHYKYHWLNDIKLLMKIDYLKDKLPVKLPF